MVLASAVQVSLRAFPFLPLKPLALKISWSNNTDVFLSPDFMVSVFLAECFHKTPGNKCSAPRLSLIRRLYVPPVFCIIV